jgi:hypothetical protein
MFGLALIFFARAIGEFRLVDFFNRVHGSAFARLDRLVFSRFDCYLRSRFSFLRERAHREE